jgi:hypothetical protein
MATSYFWLISEKIGAEGSKSDEKGVDSLLSLQSERVRGCTLDKVNTLSS